MKKLLVRLLLILAGVAGLTIPAKAQALDQIVVNIPFEFVAAGRTFPAGEYRISRLRDEQPRVLLLASMENRANVVMLRTETQTTPSDQPKLAFVTVGDHHILSRIDTTNYAYILSVPSAEGLVAANSKKSAAPSSSSGNN
ncbi:MAG TPA: hypothetical protein VNB49_08020 [Candidatus Dormibacteraeota bacterium]|nr:hypothetical protein [Candidatus Dormibacteraeota bacterium]